MIQLSCETFDNRTVSSFIQEQQVDSLDYNDLYAKRVFDRTFLQRQHHNQEIILQSGLQQTQGV